jgi:hypothetical protein
MVSIEHDLDEEEENVQNEMIMKIKMQQTETVIKNSKRRHHSSGR